MGERLAACVNVLPEMESTYRWQGVVETERERQIVIKTTSDRLPALEKRLHQLHSFDVPEFIVVPITAGSAKYLSWMTESTSKTG